MTNDILEFQGEHRWLSNFWPAQVVFEGHTYPTVENAYQAAKVHPSTRAVFRTCSPGQAKRLGRSYPIREDWESEKVAVMRALVGQKFSSTSPLGRRLAATGSCMIVEVNTWGDVFWGKCCGQGKNTLGVLLMEQRTFLQKAGEVSQ